MSPHSRVGPINRRFLDELLPDLDLFTTIIDTYCRQAPLLLRGIEQAVAGDDRPAAARSAHDLASTSGQVGAAAVSHLAREIEQLAETGGDNLDERCARVGQLLPAALAELHRIRAAHVSSNR